MTGAYVVQIVAPTGRVVDWDRYANREQAEAVARQLRVHGFFAQVRRVEREDAAQ